MKKGQFKPTVVSLHATHVQVYTEEERDNSSLEDTWKGERETKRNDPNKRKI